MNKHAMSLKLTAVAVSLMVALALFYLFRADLRRGHVIITGASQWHHTTLADGTALHVDARSRVKVEYTNEARIVYVDEGSAVFEVAKDSRRPFIVRTPLVDATAVGTRFGVSIDPGVTTTVSEGIVKVIPHGQHWKGAGIVLKAGEELRVPESTGSEPTHIKVNAEQKLEWATGWLVFEEATIGEIVSELNRRNEVQIKIEQPEVAARPMRGFQRFRVDSSTSFARYIAEINDLTLIEDPHGAVLYLRPKAGHGH